MLARDRSPDGSSGSRLVTPVDVSLWTTSTARIGVAVLRQLRFDHRRDRRRASSRQARPRRRGRAGAPPRPTAVANSPISNASTLSPGDSVLTSAASHAPDARRRKDHHRAGGLEDRLQAVEHLAPQRGELRAAVVDRRLRHRPQHAIGHVGRTGNLEEVPSASMHGQGNRIEELRSADDAPRT